MTYVSIAELRAEISRYLDRVEHGEEITITRRGKAIAKLTPSVKPPIDLSDMDDLDEELGLYDETNAVVEAREDYRY